MSRGLKNIAELDGPSWLAVAYERRHSDPRLGPPVLVGRAGRPHELEGPTCPARLRLEMPTRNAWRTLLNLRRRGNPCVKIAGQTGLTPRRVVERRLNHPRKCARISRCHSGAARSSRDSHQLLNQLVRSRHGGFRRDKCAPESPPNGRRRPARTRSIVAGVTSSPRASSTIGTTASRASSIVRGFRRRFPQSVMRRQRPITAPSARSRRSSSAKCSASSAPTESQSSTKRRGKAGAEPPGHVEGEVDRAEFDMRERVQHGDPAALRARFARASASGSAAAIRAAPAAPAGPASRHRRRGERAAAPQPRHLPRRHHLGARRRGQQDAAAGLGNADGHWASLFLDGGLGDHGLLYGRGHHRRTQRLGRRCGRGRGRLGQGCSACSRFTG